MSNRLIPALDRLEYPPLGAISRFDIETAVPPSVLAAGDIGCISIAFFFLVVRLQLRFRRNVLNAEDALIFLAWVIFTLGMGFEVSATMLEESANNQILQRLDDLENGLLPELETRLVNQLHQARKLNWAMQVLYHTPIYLVKFAWLRFYRILIPKFMTKTRAWMDLTLYFCVAGYVFTLVFTLSACPIANVFYQRTIGDVHETCLPFIQTEVVFLLFGFHAISEVLVFVLPLCVIVRLRNIGPRKKILVSILFLMGLFCLFLMVWNVWFSSSLLPRFDFSYNTTIAAIFWPLEPAWAIIVICLPAFRLTTEELWSVLFGKKDNESTKSERSNIDLGSLALADIGSGSSLSLFLDLQELSSKPADVENGKVQNQSLEVAIKIVHPSWFKP